MSIASSEQPVATDFSKLIECSEFGHLTLFNKTPLSVGSRVLHIPTDNYKYDVYFTFSMQLRLKFHYGATTVVTFIASKKTATRYR